jgi:hypothetical protein
MTGDYWMIELMGSADDLCCYQRWFCDQTAKVIEENGKYYLTGSHLMGCTTADEVMKRAEIKLELMSAAVWLESASHAPMVRIGSVVYVDPSGIYHSIMFIEAGSRSGVLLKRFDSFRPSLPQRVIAIAECEPHLETALKLWGKPQRTWPTLYRICEEISKSFTNKKENVSTVLDREKLIDSIVDYHRFRHSANDPSIAGPDARHAEGYNLQRPKILEDEENPTMTHQEAVLLVGSILSHAFRRKWEARSEDYTTNI